MSKISDPQAIPDQEDDMLTEYDFSNGVRGKYRDRNLMVQIPGVQFLRNSQGQKTAVLLNLQVYQNLWLDVLADIPDQLEFQYLTDEQNHTQSVFIDFKAHLSLWEMIYDRIISL
jgi:hypothetical protein